MNKTIGFQLIVYGLLLAGLSYLTQHLAPALARPTLIAGLIGGVLCLVWGLRVIAGNRGKALPLLTLLPVSFVMLSQSIITWAGRRQEVSGRALAAVVITVLFVLSIGMLMRIAYAGVVFDGEPVSPKKGDGNKSQTTGKPAAQTDAIKRA